MALQFAIESIHSDDNDLYFPLYRRPLVVQERKHFYNDLDDVEFVKRFRLSKERTHYVLDLINEKLEINNDKSYCKAAAAVATKSWEEIPGLKALPIIGSIHHLLPGIGCVQMHKGVYSMMETLRNKFGTIVKLEEFMSRGNMLVLFEPKHMEQVFRGEETMPYRDGFQTVKYFREHIRNDKFHGDYGLLTNQGEPWKAFRDKVKGPLLQLKTVRMYTKPLDEVAKEMIERLKRIRNDKNLIENTFDLEMNKFSLESIAVVGLGTRLGCLQDNLAEDSTARVLIQCVNDTFQFSYELETLPSPWRYFATPKFKKAMQTYETQFRISEDLINKAKERIEKKRFETSTEEDSILEKLLQIDQKIALIMATDMLFAGVDTVAHSVIAALYHLATHPEVQRKLREEIKRPGEDSRRYLRACIKESLRLMPIISSNLRRTTKEHLVGGFVIPEGVSVLFPHEYVALQDEHYPRAKEYIPERWVVTADHPLYHRKAHPMVYLPFGFGKRSCIGRRIAELEMELILRRFVEEFDTKWTGKEPLKRISTSMTTSTKPYHFQFDDLP